MEFHYKPNAAYPLNIVTGSGFQPNQQANWALDLTGKKLVAGSLRLVGTVQLTDSSGNGPTSGTDVYYSPAAGLHGLITNTIVTSRGAVLENTLNYGRLVAMQKFNKTSESMAGNVLDSLNGIFPNQNLTLARAFARGGDTNGNLNFCLPLMVCLNSSVSAETGKPADIPYTLLGDKSNLLSVIIRFSPLQQMVFGTSAGTFTNLVIKNLKLVWDEVVDDGHREKILLRAYQQTRNTINSGYYSLNTILASESEGMYVSFINQAHEQSQNYDYYAIEALPRNNGTGVGTSSLELLVNDSPTPFKYRLNTSDQERLYSHMLQNGWTTTSLTRTEFYQTALGELYSILFGGLLGQGNKCSMVIYNDNINSGAGYNAYGYYSSLILL